MIRDPRPSSEEIRTVLVVEDDTLVRIMVAEELREAGMRVIEAGDADEALALARANPIDLVFADIGLPGSMNGFELARRLQSNVPDLQVLFTSGRLPANVAASLRPFIAKPYDIADVVDRIRVALSGPTPE